MLDLSVPPSKREWIENELKFFSIRMRILNSKYFLFGFNWIQLDSIGCNWIGTAFPIQNFELNSIHNAQKKLTFLNFEKHIETCSMQFL